MTIWPPILADSDDGLAKLIGFLIFGGIALIGQIAAWMAKQKKQQEETERRAEIRTSIQSQGRAPVRATPLRQVTVPPAPRVPSPPLPARRLARAHPPPVPTVPMTPPEAAPAQLKSAPQPQPRRRPHSASATALGAWLKPATLRQQFILTEILQPPLAMRRRHD